GDEKVTIVRVARMKGQIEQPFSKTLRCDSLADIQKWCIEQNSIFDDEYFAVQVGHKEAARVVGCSGDSGGCRNALHDQLQRVGAFILSMSREAKQRTQE